MKLAIFSAQFSTCILLLTRYRNELCPTTDVNKLAQQIDSIPDFVRATIAQNEAIAELAQRYAENEHSFFIGRGCMYPVALEGALKLKEISYIHAEGYHAAELKHGPIALLEEGTPVIALANDIPGKDKTLGNVEECKARGARILGIITEGDDEARAFMDDVIEIPACDPLVSTIPATVALQLLAYHIARHRGCEIDQPRNLAKSVTVE